MEAPFSRARVMADYIIDIMYARVRAPVGDAEDNG